MTKKKTCFVICPIGDEGTPIRQRADFILNGIIIPAISDDFEVVRADTISSIGQITEEIIRHCLVADLIIADLSGRNPNVYYELAIADMQSKPVIAMVEKNEQLPFDVKDKRTIHYDLADWKNIEHVRSEIQKRAVESLGKNYSVSNPITMTRTMIKLSSSADPTEKVIGVLVNQVETLSRKVDTLSGRVDYNPSGLGSYFSPQPFGLGGLQIQPSLLEEPIVTPLSALNFKNKTTP